MTRRTSFERGATRDSPSRLDGGKSPLYITGWDVEPLTDLVVSVGIARQSGPDTPPQLRIQVALPPEREPLPLDLGPTPPLSVYAGTHDSGEASVLAVPDGVHPGVVQEYVDGATVSPLSSSDPVTLHPGDSVTNGYDIVPADSTVDELPSGAYRFESEPGTYDVDWGVTLWLNR